MAGGIGPGGVIYVITTAPGPIFAYGQHVLANVCPGNIRMLLVSQQRHMVSVGSGVMLGTVLA
jgi:hypothetical protein